MKPFRMLAFLCSAASLAVLGGCQQANAPEPQESANEPASDIVGPDAKPGITGRDGRLVLSPVVGRPAAVYFSVRNDSPRPATLAGVHVKDAGQAQMHKTEGGSMKAIDAVKIAAGETVTFAPGSYHVMVFDPAAALKAGNTTELTLTFADGDKLSMPLRIESIGAASSGEAMAGMDGMHH